MKPKTVRFNLPPAEFHFAGFSFPKWVFTLPKGPLSKRLSDMKESPCGPYYHAPRPNAGKGCGFYLESYGMPGLRWQWCDDVCSSIRHTGWFTDEFGDGDKIRGIVMRLPKGRGFLAGWSMGDGMISEIDSTIYDLEHDAAQAANDMAESVAEKERESQELETV